MAHIFPKEELNGVQYEGASLSYKLVCYQHGRWNQLDKFKNGCSQER